MKFKFLTKLKDWNGNAQAQEKKTCITEFFSSVIFMRFCAAQERTILLNTLIFFKENPKLFCYIKLYLSNEIKVFKKVKLKNLIEVVLFEFWKAHRRTEKMTTFVLGLFTSIAILES